jgi:hypothetical protein
LPHTACHAASRPASSPNLHRKKDLGKRRKKHPIQETSPTETTSPPPTKTPQPRPTRSAETQR